jgi:hypothetical protein
MLDHWPVEQGVIGCRDKDWPRLAFIRDQAGYGARYAIRGAGNSQPGVRENPSEIRMLPDRLRVLSHHGY